MYTPRTFKGDVEMLSNVQYRQMKEKKDYKLIAIAITQLSAFVSDMFISGTEHYVNPSELVVLCKECT